jgi:hypothetical protein
LRNAQRKSELARARKAVTIVMVAVDFASQNKQISIA